MNQLTTKLSSPLTWTFQKNKAILQSNGDTLLELHSESAVKGNFSYAGKDYRIHNEGFWNPRTVIETEGRRILTFKHNFLGRNGTAQFEGGKTYDYKIRNSPLVTLTFLTEDGLELVRYKAEGCKNPDGLKTTLTLNPHSVPEADVMMLIVMGCFAFKAFIEENNDLTFLVLVAGA